MRLARGPALYLGHVLCAWGVLGGNFIAERKETEHDGACNNEYGTSCKRPYIIDVWVVVCAQVDALYTGGLRWSSLYR